jgi:hypothetical protein
VGDAAKLWALFIVFYVVVEIVVLGKDDGRDKQWVKKVSIKAHQIALS